MITRKREILLTPKKHDIMYSDYLEICSVLEYTPFSESTFYKNFSESDFWSRHPKIVVSDINVTFSIALKAATVSFAHLLPDIPLIFKDSVLSLPPIKKSSSASITFAPELAAVIAADKPVAPAPIIRISQ